jgi:hypothetical protein
MFFHTRGATVQSRSTTFTAAPLVLLAAFFSLTFTSCSVLQELGGAAMNLSRCSFKLDRIGDFQVAGISLSGKTKLGFADAARAVAAYASGELPASFTLFVAANNPNDGSGGSTKTAATLTSFAWNLRLDDTPTISGDIAEPISIPGTGQQAMIPLRMNLDLYTFFKDKGYDKVLGLALALGGANSSASRVTLRAKPTIRTEFGPLTYPGEIDIIDKEFRGK